MFDDEFNPAERRAQHSGLAWIVVIVLGLVVCGCGGLAWAALR